MRLRIHQSPGIRIYRRSEDLLIQINIKGEFKDISPRGLATIPGHVVKSDPFHVVFCIHAIYLKPICGLI